MRILPSFAQNGGELVISEYNYTMVKNAFRCSEVTCEPELLSKI